MVYMLSATSAQTKKKAARIHKQGVNLAILIIGFQSGSDFSSNTHLESVLNECAEKETIFDCSRLKNGIQNDDS